MTIDEASKLYNIPLEILHEYEKWGLCNAVKKVMGSWQYDDSDLENLSLIMTLHDIGFNIEEIENYMRLLLDKNNHSDKLQLYSLNKKRLTNIFRKPLIFIVDHSGLEPGISRL